MNIKTKVINNYRLPSPTINVILPVAYCIFENGRPVFADENKEVFDAVVSKLKLKGLM